MSPLGRHDQPDAVASAMGALGAVSLLCRAASADTTATPQLALDGLQAFAVLGKLCETQLYTVKTLLQAMVAIRLIDHALGLMATTHHPKGGSWLKAAAAAAPAASAPSRGERRAWQVGLGDRHARSLDALVSRAAAETTPAEPANTAFSPELTMTLDAASERTFHDSVNMLANDARATWTDDPAAALASAIATVTAISDGIAAVGARRCGAVELEALGRVLGPGLRPFFPNTSAVLEQRAE
jgi:hypothetical protein